MRRALAAVRSDERVALADVLSLAFSDDHFMAELVPEAVFEAVMMQFETEGDIATGGMDQMVWNCGAERAREIAQTFLEVGAAENGALIARLADELQRLEAEVSADAINRGAAAFFLHYRDRVKGPDFAVPSLKEEVGRALLEYVRVRRHELPDPVAALTWVD